MIIIDGSADDALRRTAAHMLNFEAGCRMFAPDGTRLPPPHEPFPCVELPSARDAAELPERARELAAPARMRLRARGGVILLHARGEPQQVGAALAERRGELRRQLADGLAEEVVALLPTYDHLCDDAVVEMTDSVVLYDEVRVAQRTMVRAADDDAPRVMPARLIKHGIGVGDGVCSEAQGAAFVWTVYTYYRIPSMPRSYAEWLQYMTTIVFDEVGDLMRGDGVNFDAMTLRMHMVMARVAVRNMDAVARPAAIENPFAARRAPAVVDSDSDGDDGAEDDPEDDHGGDAGARAAADVRLPGPHRMAAARQPGPHRIVPAAGAVLAAPEENAELAALLRPARHLAGCLLCGAAPAVYVTGADCECHRVSSRLLNELAQRDAVLCAPCGEAVGRGACAIRVAFL